VIITTMNDLPGRRDRGGLGEVFGLTTWTEICAYGTAVRVTRL
jgi:uncharacterized protein YbjQ (UPF0145 family)